MPEENIQLIAKKIVGSGKGILAADESANTIKKRFFAIICIFSSDIKYILKCNLLDQSIYLQNPIHYHTKKQFYKVFFV